MLVKIAAASSPEKTLLMMFPACQIAILARASQYLPSVDRLGTGEALP